MMRPASKPAICLAAFRSLACAAFLSVVLAGVTSQAAEAVRWRLVLTDESLVGVFRQIADESFVVEENAWGVNSARTMEGLCRGDDARALERTIFVFSAAEDDGAGAAWRERLSNQGYRTIVLPEPRGGNGRAVYPERLRLVHETLCSLHPHGRPAYDVRLRRALQQLSLLTWSAHE